MTQSVATTGGAPMPQLRENSLFFVGNATVLLRIGGFTVLTDPNFIHKHEKVGIGYGMTATRQTDPAIDIEQLPPIDLVILSHWHGDHFDQVAEAKLDRTIPIVTTREAARELESRDFENLLPVERWETAEFENAQGRLRVTATPGRHGPPVVSIALPDVMGSVVEFEGASPAPRIYISGDTLMFDDIEEIPQRFPGLDYGVVHLGGTEVLGIMVTMNDEQGLQLLQTVNPAKAVPIHYDDYDVFKSPLEDFLAAATGAGWGDRVVAPARGETVDLIGQAARA